MALKKVSERKKIIAQYLSQQIKCFKSVSNLNHTVVLHFYRLLFVQGHASLCGAVPDKIACYYDDAMYVLPCNLYVWLLLFR